MMRSVDTAMLFHFEILQIQTGESRSSKNLKATVMEAEMSEMVEEMREPPLDRVVLSYCAIRACQMVESMKDLKKTQVSFFIRGRNRRWGEQYGVIGKVQ